MIEFISQESFPEDPYIKELVYLQIDLKSRLAYVRKPMKNGGLFWTCLTCAVMKNGEKKYIDAIEWDSNFLKKDIIAFLETRSWESSMRREVQMTHFEKPCTAALYQKYENAPAPAAQMSFLDECPF